MATDPTPVIPTPPETTPPEFFYTLRRADGHEIGGEYVFLTALNDKDWDGAEADAYDLDEREEYWLDTWVLVKRESRMLGPEPFEDEDDEDDEPVQQELLGDRLEIVDTPDINSYASQQADIIRDTGA